MATLANIDQLVTSGLTSPRNLAYTRIILSDPETGITNMVYRNLAIKLYSKIMKYVLTDATMYQRLRSLLMSETKLEDFLLEATPDEGTDDAFKFAQSMVPGQSNIRKTIKKVMQKHVKN